MNVRRSVFQDTRLGGARGRSSSWLNASYPPARNDKLLQFNSLSALQLPRQQAREQREGEHPLPHVPYRQGTLSLLHRERWVMLHPTGAMAGYRGDADARAGGGLRGSQAPGSPRRPRRGPGGEARPAHPHDVAARRLEETRDAANHADAEGARRLLPRAHGEAAGREGPRGDARALVQGARRTRMRQGARGDMPMPAPTLEDAIALAVQYF